MSIERRALTAEEFAIRWAITPDDVNDLRKSGKLPYMRFGTLTISYPVGACDRAMARLAVTAKSDPVYQRNARLGKRIGTSNRRAAK